MVFCIQEIPSKQSKDFKFCELQHKHIYVDHIAVDKYKKETQISSEIYIVIGFPRSFSWNFPLFFREFSWFESP